MQIAIKKLFQRHSKKIIIAAILVLQFLPDYFTPHHTLTEPSSGKWTYTIFSLAGSTVIGIGIAAIPIYMIVIALLELNGKKKIISTVNNFLLLTFFLSLLYIFWTDPINYLLDTSRQSINNTTVISSSVERRVGRRGGTVYAAYLFVKLPDSTDMKFKYKSIKYTDIDKFQAPKTISFEYGRGYLNWPYVSQVTLHND